VSGDPRGHGRLDSSDALTWNVIRVIFMGLITEFFVASEIDGVVIEQGPDPDHVRVLSSKNVDTVKLTTLWGIAARRDYSVDGGFMDLSDELEGGCVGEPEDDGPWLYRLPGALGDALASADSDRLREISSEWATTDEWALDGASGGDELMWLVEGLADLARDARAGSSAVYLWMSL
jgi:hypothetical protein